MISIAMATYNGERYLREQLDSILAQTITDWELVVCDDCSRDSTVQILEEYQNKDSRIHIVVNEKNLGFKKNFGKAIGYCSGEYIALADQDDIWYNNHLEVLKNSLGDSSIACGNASLISGDGELHTRKLNEVDCLLYVPSENEKLLYRILFISNPFQGASMLIRRDLLSNVLPIPNSVLYHDAWIAACASLECGISYTFDTITYYRQHENNVTAAANRLKRPSFMKKIKRGLRVLFLKEPVYTDRFSYLKELSARYGTSNEDLKAIEDIYNHVLTKKLNLLDIIFLFKNWYFISTTKSYKGFFSFLLKLVNMRPYNE